MRIIRKLSERINYVAYMSFKLSGEVVRGKPGDL